MKVKSPFEGNCKHGISNKEPCDKCWKAMAKAHAKATKKLLEDMAKAEKLGKKSKLHFD